MVLLFFVVVFFFFFFVLFFFMPPTSLKLEGHIASGLFVRPSVRSSRFLVHSITLEP